MCLISWRLVDLNITSLNVLASSFQDNFGHQKYYQNAIFVHNNLQNIFKLIKVVFFYIQTQQYGWKYRKVNVIFNAHFHCCVTMTIYVHKHIIIFHEYEPNEIFPREANFKIRGTGQLKSRTIKSKIGIKIILILLNFKHTDSIKHD